MNLKYLIYQGVLWKYIKKDNKKYLTIVPIKEVKELESHNAQPCKEGRCCDSCNQTKVIPERLRRFRA